MRIGNQTFLITGGANGIGKSLVEDLSPDARAIQVLDKDRTALNDLQAGFPDIRAFVCNLTDFQEVNRAVKNLSEASRAPTVLVNNAGLIHSEPLVSLLPRDDIEQSVENWLRVVDANLNSVFFVTRCVVEHWIRNRIKGLVINIGSIAAYGNAGQSAYSAAKAGVNALTVTWSKELGPFGIRSTAIAPGFFNASSTRASLKDSQIKEWQSKTPLRRLGELEEVSKALRFIVENDFYNGRILELDGGLRI